MPYVNCSCFPQSLFILHTGRMIAKTAGNCCEGNICACTAEKVYRDICLEQLSLSFWVSHVKNSMMHSFATCWMWTWSNGIHDCFHLCFDAVKWAQSKFKENFVLSGYKLCREIEDSCHVFVTILNSHKILRDFSIIE